MKLYLGAVFGGTQLLYNLVIKGGEHIADCQTNPDNVIEILIPQSPLISVSVNIFHPCSYSERGEECLSHFTVLTKCSSGRQECRWEVAPTRCFLAVCPQTLELRHLPQGPLGPKLRVPERQGGRGCAGTGGFSAWLRISVPCCRQFRNRARRQGFQCCLCNYTSISSA